LALLNLGLIVNLLNALFLKKGCGVIGESIENGEDKEDIEDGEDRGEL